MGQGLRQQLTFGRDQRIMPVFNPVLQRGAMSAQDALARFKLELLMKPHPV
jgi:hypothetical protein